MIIYNDYNLLLANYLSLTKYFIKICITNLLYYKYILQIYKNY